MENKELLELCLKISGSFENGDPAYDALTGNSDGEGISVGILQWNAGAGSLATLIQHIIDLSSAEAVNAFFSNGEDVASIAQMSAGQAKQFCIQSFLSGVNVTSQGIQDWQSFLQSDASVQAQIDLATNSVLSKAMNLAAQFSPNTNNLRDIAYFFDVVTQQGGMQNQRGSVSPLADAAQSTKAQAIQMAQQHSAKTAEYWSQVTGQDTQASILLHYAYQRALLGRAEYVWDTLSRRGAIACRGGVVHGSWFDFSQLLP